MTEYGIGCRLLRAIGGLRQGKKIRVVSQGASAARDGPTISRCKGRPFNK